MVARCIFLLNLTFLMIVVSGCARLYEMDMASQRRINLNEDLAYLDVNNIAVLPEPLSLDDVVRIGVENNLEMRISRIMAEIADDNALSEKMKMLPQMNLNGDVSHRSDYDLKEYEDLDTGAVTLGRSISQEKTHKVISLSLSWNVLDFGLSFIRARQAAMKTEIQRMERLRQSQNLALEIASAYWKAILTQSEADYVANIEAEVLKYKEKAREMVAQNRIDPVAAKGIEKKIAELSITANNLQADISGARIDLCRLMGLNPLTSFILADVSFENYLEKIPEAASLEAEKLEMIALNNRPECFAEDIRIRVQQDEARSALVSMFPGIRLDISGYYDDNKYLINNDWASVGLSVMSNLLSLPSKYANWKAQKKNEAMAEAQRLMLTAGIIAQTHMALHDFAVKEKRFELYDNAYTVSQELLSMIRERYELGAVSETEMTQQTMENMISRLGRNRAMLDMIHAYHMLLVTLGLDYDRWEEELKDMNEEVILPDIQEKDIVNTGGN